MITVTLLMHLHSCYQEAHYTQPTSRAI